MMRYSSRLPQWPRLAVLVILAAILAGCGRDASIPEAIPVATVAAYPGNADPPLLVEATWVQERIGDPESDLVVLDASDLATYRAGHIPGAIHAWWQDTMDPNGRYYGGIIRPDENAPDPQLLRRHLVEDLGVTPESQVVIYDNERYRWAARFVWMLRFLGYENAAVLDGGLAAWRGIGGEVESGENETPAIPPPPIDPQTGYYLTTDDVLAMLDDPNVVLLDVRSDAERADDVDETIEPGSIPGSIAIPWTAAIADEAGHLLPPDQLRVLYEQAGITPDKQIVIYARFGVETAHSWLVLKLLGYPNVLIYDGGWIDWAANPATPKEDIDSLSST